MVCFFIFGVASLDLVLRWRSAGVPLIILIFVSFQRLINCLADNKKKIVTKLILSFIQ